VSLNKGQTNYITVYKIPKKYKIKIVAQNVKILKIGGIKCTVG